MNMQSQARIRRIVAGAGGATLLEMLLYFALLAVAINIAATAFVSTVRLNTMSGAALDKLLAFEELRNDFQETVRESYGLIQEVGNWKGGQDTLIVRLPSPAGPGSGQRYAVLGVFGDRPRMSRLVLVDRHGHFEAESLKTYAVDLNSVRFYYQQTGSREASLVVLEVLTRRGEQPRRIAAAPRGLPRTAVGQGSERTIQAL